MDLVNPVQPTGIGKRGKSLSECDTHELFNGTEANVNALMTQDGHRSTSGSGLRQGKKKKTAGKMSEIKKKPKLLKQSRIADNEQDGKKKGHSSPPQQTEAVTIISTSDVTTKERKSVTFISDNGSVETFIKSCAKYTFGKCGSRECDIIEKLKSSGLYEKFPGKLNITDATAIITDTEQSETGQGALKRFLLRLATSDFSCRDNMGISLLTCQEDDENLGLHPMDHFLFCYLSCSLFLRQLFVQKAIYCRLAIPILYPSPSKVGLELTSWPLRFQSIEGRDSQGDQRDIDLRSCKTLFVCFLRVGRSSTFQKSHILNCVLTESGNHPTFHCWDQPNSDRERVFSEGTVEGSWYLPGYRPEDIFSRLTMFLNLRGDSEKFPVQCEILCKASNVIVLVVDIHQAGAKFLRSLMQKTLENKRKVVIVLNDDSNGRNQREKSLAIKLIKDFEHVKDEVNFILTFQNNKRRTKAFVVKKLQQVIEGWLRDDGKDQFSFDTLLNACKQYDACIFHDEDLHECAEGRALAKCVVDHIKISNKKDFERVKTEVSALKSEKLPLHSSLWQKWSDKLKEKQRSSSYSAQYDKMLNICHKQAEHTCTLSGIMQAFLDALQVPDGRVLFFLSWLKYFLDDISKMTMPHLLKEYHSKWFLLQKRKVESLEAESKVDIDKLKKEVKQAETDLSAASFGLEHFIREIGLMYEATKAIEGNIYDNMTSIELGRRIEFLPGIIAKVILAGHPIELLDGDTVNIPLTWLEKIFQHLKDEVGQKKLLVISVLGIQSSGKSTLLNTMFGLQFALSAARYTRGAFIQVLKVEKESELPFDYVCIIDSGGLRAPESGHRNYDHDNQLATLIIGLGDVTLINIKGKNYAEMKDILQIAVQAFLHMNVVLKQHKRRCIFIHQNVPAASAEDKLAHGCQKLQEQLDEMTLTAARSEGIKGIHSFSQVIQFDCREDVYFFPDFWQNNPPMGHVNPLYCAKVVEVRNRIFESILKSSKEGYFFFFDQVMPHIKDIWEAILDENFVLSFKNSLEISAFKNFRRLCWKFSTEMIEQPVEVYIRNDAFPKIEDCQDEGEFIELKGSLFNHLQNLATPVKANIGEYFTQYIADESDSNILEQWQDEFKTTIENNCREKLRDAKAQIVSYKILIFDEKISGQPNTESLYEIEDWENELPALLTEEDIKQRLLRIVCEVTGDLKEYAIDQVLKHNCYQFKSFEKLVPNLIPLRGDIDHPDPILDDATRIVKEIFQDFESNVVSATRQGVYPFTHVKDLLSDVFACLGQQQASHGFSFRPQYRTRVLVLSSIFASTKIFHTLREVKQIPEEIECPIKNDEAFANKICRMYINEVFQAKSFRLNLIDKIVQHLGLKYRNKNELLNIVLDYLASSEDFDEFREYFRSPADFSIDLMQDLFAQYLDKPSGENRDSPFVKIVRKALSSVIAECCQKIQMLKCFGLNSREEWEEKIKLPLKTIQSDNIKKTEKTPFNSESFALTLDSIFREIEKTPPLFITNATFTEFLDEIEHPECPIGAAFDKLLGCKERCPLCGEMCSRDDAKHIEKKKNHKCFAHRPMAISGKRYTKSRKLIIDLCHEVVGSKDTFYNLRAGHSKGRESFAEDQKANINKSKKVHGNWDLKQNGRNERLDYWKWFLVKYGKLLAKTFPDAECPDIPESWKSIAPPTTSGYKRSQNSNDILYLTPDPDVVL